jgi:hypothetical protein
MERKAVEAALRDLDHIGKHTPEELAEIRRHIDDLKAKQQAAGFPGGVPPLSTNPPPVSSTQHGG